MIIHHLASTHEGGAGMAAEKLSEKLQDKEHTHRLFSAFGSPSTRGWTNLSDKPPKHSGPRARLHRLLLSLGKKNRPRSPEPLSLAHLGSLPPPDSPLWRCDVLNFQWLGGSWLDFHRLAEAIPDTLPVVWTMHDLNPVTAICHYPGKDCTALAKGCGTCPWVGGLSGNHILRSSYEAKMVFYRRKAPHLVTICDWQDRLVKTSPLGQAAGSVTLIPNAFDRDGADAGLSRSEARTRLGLSPDTRYILTGASKLTNQRKGTDMLAEVARNAPPGWQWITFGSRAEEALPGLPATHFGVVENRQHLGAIYAAADLFILPSREECLAQTGLEALANGTPVLTAANTGPADYVLSGETGLLAASATADAFIATLHHFNESSALHDPLRVRAAFNALHAERFSADVVRAAYNRLYASALAR